MVLQVSLVEDCPGTGGKGVSSREGAYLLSGVNPPQTVPAAVFKNSILHLSPPAEH